MDFEYLGLLIVGWLLKVMFDRLWGAANRQGDFVTWEKLKERCADCKHDKERFEDSVGASIQQLGSKFDSLKEVVLSRLPSPNDGK